MTCVGRDIRRVYSSMRRPRKQAPSGSGLRILVQPPCGAFFPQTPKTKLQTPEKLQATNINQTALNDWILEFGAFLVFGVWSLVFAVTVVVSCARSQPLSPIIREAFCFKLLEQYGELRGRVLCIVCAICRLRPGRACRNVRSHGVRHGPLPSANALDGFGKARPVRAKDRYS